MNEWKSEPDRVEFESDGFPCLIVRGPVKALCGYVALPPGHPWHGKHYNDVEPSPDVHWGLTYSNKCHGKICHEAKAGEPDNVWWLGFDCAHSGDLCPGMEPILYEHGYSAYRNIAYVKKECEKLAQQCKQAA
jgi:hypothetical protein